MFFNWKYSAAILAGVILDHLTKWWARNGLEWGESIVVIPKLLSLQLIFNKGAAYGLFHEYPHVISAIAIVVIIAAYIWQDQFDQSKWSRLGLSFIMMGAIGNVTDRLWNSHVTDMFNIHIIPVFNVADICINIGALFLIIDFAISSQSKESS